MKSVGISESEIRNNEELTTRIEGYFEDKVPAVDILATIFQTLKKKKLIDPENEAEIGEKCQTMMNEIADIKIQEQTKIQEQAEQQADKEINPKHLPSHLKDVSGKFSKDALYKKFDTGISDIRSKIKQKNEKSGNASKKITHNDIIESYLLSDDFKELTPKEKNLIREMLGAHSAKKSAKADKNMSENIVEVVQGKRSRENYELMRDRVLYHGESVAQATAYANKTL